ncbi:MAG: hypothetical protein AAB929_03750 [Patescibacteria group bacterium]
MKTQKPSLIHQIEQIQPGFPLPTFAVAMLVVLLVGIGVGYGATKFKGTKGSSFLQGPNGSKTAGPTVNKKIFKDKAEGILKEGGIDGEGNFHLERPGGLSQNVYLTSSTVDLSQYIGKKVRVHGETFSGQKAGWLMDVGSVEVL